MKAKTLVFRLSAMGDVILSTSFLNGIPDGEQVDWVTRKEWAPLLKGHPKIQKVWEYDSKTGAKGWLNLVHQLIQQKYEFWFDLHDSLRTRLARLLLTFSSSKKPRLRVIQKQRCRRLVFFLFKKRTPFSVRPEPMRVLFSRLVGSQADATQTSFSFLDAAATNNDFQFKIQDQRKQGKRIIAVMPSSKWQGKEWPKENWLSLFGNSNYVPVVLGTQADPVSVFLVQNIPNSVSAVGIGSLENTAKVLKQCDLFVGVDTGLAHLAESLGIPAVVLFGPTHSDLGFGPFLPNSVAVNTPLWCSPCSKDGTACFRIQRRFECQKTIDPMMVLEKINQVLKL